MWRTLPARRAVSSAATLSSIGTAGSTQCSWKRSMRSTRSRASASSTCRASVAGEASRTSSVGESLSMPPLVATTTPPA